MAWATTIGPDMRQIDYRLEANVGCGRTLGDTGQVEYRLDSDRPLEWIGEGLHEVGIEPGAVLDDAGKQAARRLADGRHPGTGERLVAAKKAVDPRAKLDAGPLVDAVREAAERAGVSPAQLLDDPRAAARYGRLQRGVARERLRAGGRGRDVDAAPHRAPVGDLEKVAKAAGLSLDDLYDPAELATAREHKNARVAVGNRGYDLTLDLPKSYSVLMAMADPVLAGELEEAYLGAVRETASAMQQWAGYGMRGHHGDGQRAQRVEGTGLLGWMTVHRTARPVAGQAPDPHLHAHVTIANMVRGVDGQWSTIGAGGRDIHRHVKAAGTFMQARLRAITGQRWGIEWARDPGTGAWEITHVPTSLRTVFSKRHGQITDALDDAGIDRKNATTEQQKAAAQRSKRDKAATAGGVDLRDEWQRQAVASGVDVDELLAAAMPGPGRPAPDPEPIAVLAEQVFAAPETGLTAHRKVVTRADVLAAVVDTQAAGVADLAEAEQLVDQVLAEPVAVPLPPAGPTHLSNAARYTSADVVEAERTVLEIAEMRFGARVAVLPTGTVTTAIEAYELGAGHQLSSEQRAVIDRLATAGHGIDTVIGVAGAGKTTIMAALRTAYEAHGMTVRGAATAAVAAQGLQTGAVVESVTVARWLRDIAEGDGLDGVHVLIVDEAAMVDDRHMATLAAEALRTGTKLVAIGDPLQMKAVGVGGTFAAVHAAVGGLQLTENRRQSDPDERQALATWRADQRRAALQQWADTKRVHVTGTPEQAHAVMVQQWARLREQWPDPHDRIAELLMLAHRNTDVDELNQRARAVRVAAGELGPDSSWQLAEGATITFAAGDAVMTRANDRQLGVLNGYRGIVTAVDERGRVQFERRVDGPDGPQLERAWLPAGYIERGHLQHAYAITAAKAQGMTADQALVYGVGMDAHTLYPAMSRDRRRADLWLALAPLESDADRARLGTPRTEGEARQRAVDAYAAALEHDLPDRLVLTELGDAPQPDPTALRWRRLTETARDVHRGVADFAATLRDSQDPAPAVDRGPADGVDELAARVAALGDEQLRRPTPRDELRERLQRAALTPQQRAAADEHARQHAMRELRAIAAGDPPSGRFSRAQLHEALDVVRTENLRAQRQAALAAGGRAEQVPAGATLRHVPWQQRPHGNVPTEQLADKAARAEQAAARIAAAAAARERAEQARLAEARAGQGPAMRELEQQRAQLAAAVDAARQVEQHRRAARAHETTAREARDQIRALQDAERGRHRLAKLFRPRAEEVAREVDRLRDTAVRADRDAGEARAAAYPHEQLVARTPDAAARLAELERHWPDRTAAAMRADEQPPVTAVMLSAQAFPRERRTPEALLQRAAGLRAEAALRERLDPGLARAEDASRRIAQARERIARAQLEAETRRNNPQPDHDYYRDHDRHIDHGPDLGL